MELEWAQVTPNFDSFAQDALVFDRAYCNMAICSASRNSFMTGRNREPPHPSFASHKKISSRRRNRTRSVWERDVCCQYTSAAVGRASGVDKEFPEGVGESGAIHIFEAINPRFPSRTVNE